MKRLSNFSLRTILTAALLIFALIPVTALVAVAWRGASGIAESRAATYMNVAVNMADKIDRNLFERYGDVQAFGLNRVLTDRVSWYKQGDASPIVGAMDQYVDTYDIYYLTLLVDLDGKLIAVNSKDDSGRAVSTDWLYDVDFSKESWFADCLANRFYEDKSGSVTGTVVEHLYQDAHVQKVYGGQGLALGYAAPVYDEDGQVIAVWKNVTKFSLVEDIVLATYEDLKSQGMETAEITLLDEAGHVIVDCDPSENNGQLVRDENVIGKLNLADSGVEAAQLVVRGERGYLTNSLHARKGIEQVVGFTPLQGALGFPGMKWNVLVRVPVSQALAGANWIKQFCTITWIATAVLVSIVAVYFSRSIANAVLRAVASMESATRGDYSKRATPGPSTELTRMSTALNTMLTELNESSTVSNEAARLRGIIEDSDAAFMMVDRDLIVSYVNNATRELLAKHQETFRRFWPAFDAANIVGQCIDQFHKEPGHQRKLLSDPKNLPYKTDITVGPLIISLSVSAVYDAKGEHVGSALEWQDVTEERQREAIDADFRSQIAAIEKSQAVIEFKMDGTIVRANENFQGAVGYREDEIVGKHHSMFAEPEFAASPEYAEFWAKLNRGEFVAGEFKRLAKGAREIWIQASYNPIFDLDGNPVKVVKYASDITASKQMEQSVRESQQREQQEAELQQQKVSQLLSVVNAVAAGDLSVQMPELGDDGVGQVAEGVGKAVEAIRAALAQVRDVSSMVATSSRDLASASEQISNGAQTQASSLEETAASLEEITSAVKQNTDNSMQAQQLSSSSRDVAESGGNVVGNAVDAMTAINNASKKIAEIITTIDEIAFQTNLLALNAAVEAARAGEQGRGFAVVASEVRNLAQRSAGAAKEIKNLIQDSVTKVENGTELVNRSGDTLQEIVTSVKRVADIVTEISAASTEQLTGIEQVNSAVSQMDRVTQSNAAQTTEMNNTTRTLLSHAEQLAHLVDTFQLGDATAQFTVPAPVAAAPEPVAQDWSAPAPADPGAGMMDLDLVGAGMGDGGAGDFVDF